MDINYYISEIQEVSFHFNRGDVSVNELMDYTVELEKKLKNEDIDLMDFTQKTRILVYELHDI